MKIIPLASDSIGVRSMATFVETKDVSIMIDPSAALGPKRYQLPPTNKEIETLQEIKNTIKEYVFKSEILTISHYHYDHYDPIETFYDDKKIYAKNINDHINKSQKQRGFDFQNHIQDNCELTYSDDSVHYFNDTILCFSPPFFHGPEDVRLGFVIMTTVTDQTTTLVHASDVQGPVTKDATEYIINQKPDIVIMDGPPTLFLGWRFSKKNLKDATDNLIRIIKQTNCDIILDHHLLRDVHYRNRFAEPYKRYPNKIKSFAEYQGKENLMLEAQRKTIWQQEHK